MRRPSRASLTDAPAIAREAAAPTWNRAGSVASSSVFAASAPNIEGILPRSVEIICAWTCRHTHVPAA